MGTPKGIYKILNIITNEFYIGSSSNNINMRWRKHKSDLNHNRHPNKHLQAAFNKYGFDSFKFEIIEECEPNKCIEREQYYIDTLHPQYNKAPIAGSSLGRKASLETRLKMSKVRKGQNNKHLIGNTFRRGTKVSEESRKRMSEAQTLKFGKKVKDDLGNIYLSITEASRKNNINKKTVTRSITFQYKTKIGRTFYFVSVENK